MSYGAATGDLEGWTSRGAALDALKSAEGPGFLGAPSGAAELTHDAENGRLDVGAALCCRQTHDEVGDCITCSADL